MRSLVGEVTSHGPASRLLMVNQFGINVGFYMLMPYLASYLSGPLALGGMTIGLILGVRNFSQQGMFFLGGTLADRFGYKPLIVAGCTTRTLGFALLATVQTVPALLVAAAATGFAGAMFNPAVRAYLASESGDRRLEAFALFNVFYQAGILAGPLVGIALLSLDFRMAAVVATVVFGGLTILQMFYLPASRSAEADTGSRARVLQEWRVVFANHSFLLFAAAMIAPYALSFQIYLALPLQAQRVAGTQDAANALITATFVVSGLLAIIGQLKITAWLKERWSSGRCLATGAATLAASFLPLALLPSAGSPGGAGLAAAAVLVCGVMLALGTAAVFPFEMDTITRLSGDRLIATHYGFYNTAVGVGVLVANVSTGTLFDAADSLGRPALPWVILALVGAASTAGLVVLNRTHLRVPALSTGHTR